MAKKSPGTKKADRDEMNTPTPVFPAFGVDEQTLAERIVWICLGLLVFLVPIAVSNLTFLGFDLPFTFDQFDIVKVVTMRGILIVALAAWAWETLMQGGRIRRTRIDWLILALLAWVLLSTVFSIHPPTAVFGKYRRFEGLLSFITYAVGLFLVVQAVDRPSKMRSLARTLVMGSFIVSGYGVLQYLGLDPQRWGNLPFEANRAFSTYGNPDLFGGYLMFPLIMSITLAFSERHKVWRLVYWVAFMINVFAWLVAFTRGAWIGGVAGLIVVAFVAFRVKVRFTSEDWVPVGIMGAGAAAIVYRSLQSSHQVMNIAKRITSIFEFQQGSARSRFLIWDAAIKATADSPILGHGPDTFRLLFPKYKPIEYVEQVGYRSVADNVHNYPLQTSSAMGIPGVLLLYGTFAAALVVSAKDAVLNKVGGERWALTGFWAASFAYLVHLLFGLSVTGSTILLWVSLGVLLTTTARSVELGPADGSSARMAGAVAAVILAAVLLIGNGVYFWADHSYMQARVGTFSAQERIQKAEGAVDLDPWNDMYRAEVGLQYQDVFVAAINQARSAQQAGQDPAAYLQQADYAFRQAEQAFLETIEFIPPEYDNYVFLSNLYNMGGLYLNEQYFERAAAIAERGIEVEEYGPAVRLQYAWALDNLGRQEEAVEELEYASEMDPDYTDAHFMLANLYAKMERWQDAVDRYEIVLELSPEHVEAQANLAQAQEELEGATNDTGTAEGTAETTPAAE